MIWAERKDIAPDIGEHLAKIYGIAAPQDVWFIKFDNSLNALWSTDENPRDFSKTTSLDLLNGKHWMVRGTLNELFSHIAFATAKFMESQPVDVALAVGMMKPCRRIMSRVSVGSPRPLSGWRLTKSIPGS